MTNGEKLKEVFPNAEIDYGLRGVVAVTFIHKTIFDLDWWNAEYKEPTTKNDLGVDCIDRQIISDYVESHIQEINTGYGDLNRHTNSILRMIVDYIENMPSATPQQPKTGHWIEKFNDIEGEVRFTCSCCGKYQLFGTDFCYNCGAKMTAEVEK